MPGIASSSSERDLLSAQFTTDVALDETAQPYCYAADNERTNGEGDPQEQDSRPHCCRQTLIQVLHELSPSREFVYAIQSIA
jgi:hypothetical protein